MVKLIERLVCLFVGHKECSTCKSIVTQYSGSYDYIHFCLRCDKEIFRNHWGHVKEDHPCEGNLYYRSNERLSWFECTECEYVGPYKDYHTPVE